MPEKVRLFSPAISSLPNGLGSLTNGVAVEPQTLVGEHRTVLLEASIPKTSQTDQGQPAVLDAALVAGKYALYVSPVTAPLSYTAAAPAQASVGVASGAVVAAATNTVRVVLVNTSANRMSLGLGVAAELDKGITLMGNGGSVTIENYTGAINAISAGAASNLSIQVFTA